MMLMQVLCVLVIFSASFAYDYDCPDQLQKFFAHPKSCEKFIECNKGVAEEIDCFAGMYFNPTVEYCDFPENVVCVIEEDTDCLEDNGPVGECPAGNGIYVDFLTDAGDCSVFYMCNWGTPIQMKCPADLHFNPTLNVCDYAEAAGCTI